MRIEKRITQRTIETCDNVYVANDGKEFKNKSDCTQYEHKIALTVLRESDNVIEAPHTSNLCPYGRDSNDDFWVYRWYYIKNERGLQELIAVIGEQGYSITDRHNWIGQWICLEYEYDDHDDLYGNAFVYTLSATEKEHQMLLDILDKAQHKTETVTEVCPNCDHEVTLVWNPRKQGFKAFCPHCGARLMLCSECKYRNGELHDDCDYDSATDTCRFNRKEDEK